MLKKTSFFLAIHDIRDVSILVTSARSLRFVAFYPERILQLQLIYFKVHVFFFSGIRHSSSSSLLGNGYYCVPSL